MKFQTQESIFAKFLKTVIWICSIMALFIPFIVENRGFFPFVGGKSLYFMAFAEIAFASWMILAIIDKQYRPKLNPMMIGIGIYLLVFGLATFFSLEPSRSFWSKFERMTGFLMQLHLGGYFLALSNSFKNKKDWNILFLISGSLSALMSIYFLCSKYQINIFDKALKYTSWGGMTLGNSTFLATYLMFNCFFVLYLLFIFFKNPNSKIFSGEDISNNGLVIGISALLVIPFCIYLLKSTGVYFSVFLLFLVLAMIMLLFFPHKIYLALILALNLWGLTLSGGRAAFASFFGGLILMFLLFLSFVHKNEKINKIGKILLFSFVVFSLVFLGSILKDGSYLNKEFAQSGGAARLLIWNKVLPAVWDRPLFGYGPENFELFFYKYFDQRLHLTEFGGEAWFDRAHNIVVDTLASIGILGFVSYLGIFFFAFYLLWKKFQENKTLFIEFAFVLGTLSAYFVQNLTVFDMVSSYMMFFFVLSFVSFLGNSDSKENEQSNFVKIGMAQIITIGVIFIMLIIWMNNFVIAPYKSNMEVVGAIQERNPQTRLEMFKNGMASKVGVYQIRDYLSETIDSLMQSNQLNAQQKQAFKPEADFFLEELGKTIKEAPTDYRAYIRRGYLLCSYVMAYDKTKASQAVEMFEKAVELSPNNPQSYWGLAHGSFFVGNAQKCLQAMDKAVELEPLLSKTYRLGISYAMALKNDAYVKKYAQAGLDASYKHMDNIPGYKVPFDDAIYFAGILGKTDEIFKIVDRAIIDTKGMELGFFKAGLEFSRMNNKKDKFLEYAQKGLEASEKKINNRMLDKTRDDFDVAIMCAGALQQIDKVKDFVARAIEYNPEWAPDYQKIFSTSSAPIVSTTTKK